MLNLFRKDTLTPQTERIYKVPLCIQDTIPIYRIAENGIFELESPTNKDGGKKKLHQFDRMYLFEDINFSTQDEEEKEETGKRFETLLRSMNVSYKIIVSNHYADNGKLREEILAARSPVISRSSVSIAGRPMSAAFSASDADDATRAVWKVST